jgi:hypothetical protein
VLNIISGVMFVVLSIKVIVPEDNSILSALMLLTWVVFLGVTIFAYSEKTLTKILWYVLFLMIIAAPEALVLQIASVATAYPIGDISDDFFLSTVIVCVARALSFTLIKIIQKLKIQDPFIHDSFSKEFAVMVGLDLIIVCGSAILYINIDNMVNNMRPVFAIINAGICAVLIISSLLMYKILGKSREIIRTAKKIQQLENELRLNTQIEIAESNLRAIRHNISNIFAIIKGLSETKAYDELNNYLMGIDEDIQTANEIILLENKPLSILLNNKNTLAKSYGVDFKSIISVHFVENMSNSDLCALMGNILDNAIEAAKEYDDLKYVRLTMQLSDNEYIICCENSYKYEPILKNGRFISRKPNDGSNNPHGIGTQNIKDITAKYDGNMTISYYNNDFRLKITFQVLRSDEDKCKLRTYKS